MKLKCRINGTEYNITQGVTFSEEFNETLDSGSIIISQVPKINDLNPYDDVLIWGVEYDENGEEIPFKGYVCNPDGEEKDYLERSANLTFSILYNEVSQEDGKRQVIITANKIVMDNLDSKNILYSGLAQVNCKGIVDWGTEDRVIYAQFVGNTVSFTDEYGSNLCESWKREVSEDGLNYLYYIEKDADFKFSISEIYKSTINYLVPIDCASFKFYKHLLVDSYSEDLENLEDGIYKYTIQLFSETKRLETIQLPNISVTQPIVASQKTTVFDDIYRFIDMYSPVYKEQTSEEKDVWEYEKRIKCSISVPDRLDKNIIKSVKEVFSNIYSPEFTLTTPNLRDVLAKLMQTKDCIPVLIDDVVYAMDITVRNGKFNYNKATTKITSASKSSGNFCDALKTQYSDALSQQDSAHVVEYLGFRNNGSALLTLDNMRLETSYPIYKINKIYMCYYKQIGLYHAKVDEDGSISPDTEAGVVKKKKFLCKQDITKLVKLDNERNVLSQDWKEFYAKNIRDMTIDEFAEYRFCTLGYSIGSKNIDGWGSKLTHYVNLIGESRIETPMWNITSTYIENILNFFESNLRYTYGVSNEDYIKTSIEGSEELVSFPLSLNWRQNLVHPFDNDSLGLKSIVFMVDYDAFYSGTVIHSKDDAKDDIIMNDNPNSSLSLLEQDGLSEKEKVNRFGNKGVTFNARYSTIDELNACPLGSVFNATEYNPNMTDKDLDDIIIYHREYQVYDNAIKVTYSGMKDYVLKNYYTSVYARHRTWSLMSYGEAVNRAENKKQYLLLSTKNCYFEDPKNANFSYSSNKDSYHKIALSSFVPSKKERYIDEDTNDYQINYGYILANNRKYASDINTFVCGYSLCFNLKMYDNTSMGVYIGADEPWSGIKGDTTETDETFIGKCVKNLKEWFGNKEDGVLSDLIQNVEFLTDVSKDKTGSAQKWHMIVDETTGKIENVGFYVCHIDSKNFIEDRVTDFSEDYSDVISVYKDKLFKLPYIELPQEYASNIILGNEYDVKKDNKETLDMTFQIEPITSDKNIVFSQWLMKLSDLKGQYKKRNSSYDIVNYSVKTEPISYHIYNVSYPYTSLLNIDLRIPERIMQERNGQRVICNGSFSIETSKNPDAIQQIFDTCVRRIDVIFSYITFETDGSITIVPDSTTIEFANGNIYNSDDTFRFKYKTSIDGATERMSVLSLDLTTVANGPQKISYINKRGKKRVLETAVSYESSSELTFLFKNLTEKTSSLQISTGEQIEVREHVDPNMFVCYSKDKIDKTYCYDELLSIENVPNSRKVFAAFTENEISAFSVLQDEANRNYIKVDLTNVPDNMKEDVASVSYYYYDQKSNSYHFVFGVNTDEEMLSNGYGKIYISTLSRRNPDVYDLYHNKVGESKNYALVQEPESISDLTDSDKYGYGQFFSRN